MEMFNYSTPSFSQKVRRSVGNIFIYAKNTINLVLFEIFCGLYKGARLNTGDKILLVNTGQIGDLVITTIFMRKENQPGNVYFLFDKKYCGLFVNGSQLEKIIFINISKYKYSPAYRLSTLRQLRKMGFGRAINITSGRSPINDELTLLCGAEIKERLETNNNFYRRIFTASYDKHYRSVISTGQVTEYEKQLNLLSVLRSSKPVQKHTFICIDESSANRIEAAQLQNKLASGEYMTVAPRSDWQIKDWGLENYRHLFDRVLDSTQLKIAVIGSRKGRLYGKKLLEVNPERIKNFAGALTINESIALVQNSALFIGHDSGFTHISLALKKRTIAIIGGAYFNFFFPYTEFTAIKYLYHAMPCFGCQWKCLYRYPYCIRLVTVGQVMKSIQELLSMNYDETGN